MKDLEALLHHVCEQANYSVGHEPFYEARQVKETFAEPASYLRRDIHEMRIDIKEKPRRELKSALRHLLAKFIVDDQLGSGFACLMTIESRISLDQMVEITLRAAAILGAKRVTDLLYGWVDGEPLHYRTDAALWGVSRGGAFSIDMGVHVTSLSGDRPTLHRELPYGALGYHNDIGYLHRVKVSIECEAKPALFKPQTTTREMYLTWGNGRLRGYPLPALCQMLTMSLDSYVAPKAEWHDYGELAVFRPTDLGVMAHVGFHSEANMSDYSRPPLTKEVVEQACDLLIRRFAVRTDQSDLDVAIQRWVRSKHPYTDWMNKLIKDSSGGRLSR